MRSMIGGRLALCGLMAAAAVGCGDVENQDDLERVEGALETFTPLSLLNGWTTTPFSTAAPATALVSGKVYFRGAMQTSGTNPSPFVLPVGRRPNANVYLPINLCAATKGRLFIQSSGAVTVVAEGGTFSNAQCFTSLDGVSFSVNSTGYTSLTLVNGWTTTVFGTRAPAVRNVSDVIHFVGGMATSGTNASAFTLPSGFAPSTNVYLPIDLCDGTKGRLFIDIGGHASVGTEGAFSNAQCFTSLEGVSYPLNPAGGAGFTCLTPINGWVGMPFSTRMPCLKSFNGIVRMMGAASTTGTNPVVLQLPLGLRPSSRVYIESDMFGGRQGRVIIETSGSVQAQGKASFSDAASFTSFEGVFFGQ